MRIAIVTTALFAACALAACEKKADAPKPASTAAAPAAPAQPAAPAADPKVAEAAEGLADAVKAAGAVEGGTPCEQAYNTMAAMVAQLQKNMPAGQANEAKLPEKAKFVDACGTLPKEVQQCLVMNYAMSHAQECADARAKLKPEDTERLKAMMK